VDYLKVDRSFVDGLGEEAEDTAIVSGITGLAHALGLKVIAEGVETGGQLARLREMGCDLAQGYYLAKPLPSEEASALLANDPRSRFDPGSPEGLGGGMSSPS
jgi:two-component system CheB/CheR fusion protein